MADSYLIDGYNLIHALGLINRQLGTGALEESRRKLLQFLTTSFGDDAGQITVVFDAQRAPRHLSRHQTYHGIHIQFAPDQQTADDLIETLIGAFLTPRSLVVISNDLRLQQAAHRSGSRAWTHTLLLDFLEKRPTPEKPNAAIASEEKTAQPMSPEEKEHWMKEFEALESDPELKEFFDMDRFED